MKKIVFIIVAFLYSISMQAQLSDEVNETIKQACKDVVDNFTYHVGFIADKGNSDLVKDEHIEAALEKFVGDGDGIKLLDDNNKPIIEDGAYKYRVNPPRIEITSLNNPPKFPYIKQYLLSLKKLNYTKLTIKSSNCYMSSDIRLVDEKEQLYEAALSYGQIMIGENGDKRVYWDYTEKTVRMHIKRNTYGTDSNGQPKVRWDIRMGDIKALETRKEE